MTSPSASRHQSTAVPLVASLVLWIVLVSAEPAYAYIDPGSGSMMLQLLLGGVAGLAVIGRLHWRRFSERARALFSRISE